jgi:cytochrome c553
MEQVRKQTMKSLRFTLATLAIAASSAVALAGDAAVTPGEKLADRNCAWCHGASAQGFATAPQLAGQRPAYIVNQLRGFYDHTRDNPLSQQYMWGAASKLTPASAHELAAYFANLESKPANDGEKELYAQGRQIYDLGIPEENIVACVACHGPNAEGIRQIPKLGGLSYHYLKRKLKQWGAGYHLAAEPPMPQIASKLSHEQIEALASYLSFVQ